MHHNPNSIRSYKIIQKLSPKHAARGVAQSPYPIYRHGKASLSEQPPWRAGGDPRLARGRSSYKIIQKLSPKHAARGVAQWPYPVYRHGKASLSEQPPWRAGGDPRLARGRSRVRAPGPAGVLRTLFSPPSLPSSFLLPFFRTFPTQPTVRLGLIFQKYRKKTLFLLSVLTFLAAQNLQ